uniref:Coiled-coil domain-containing protein n=1 Tax=Strongyloides venezuelensis TaxID=75913 RepID=A0A0K0F4W9_STRVS
MEENQKLKELLKKYDWKLRRYKEQNIYLKKALKVEKDKIRLVYEMFEKVLGKNANELKDYSIHDIMNTISTITDVNNSQNNACNKENNTNNRVIQNDLSLDVEKITNQRRKNKLVVNESCEPGNSFNISSSVLCQQEKILYEKVIHQSSNDVDDHDRNTPEILERLDKEIEGLSDSINTDSMIRKFSSLMSSDEDKTIKSNNDSETINNENDIYFEYSEKTPSLNEDGSKIAYYIEIPEKKSIPRGVKYRTVNEYLINNKNDFLQKSQERQKKIHQASQIRAQIAIEKRAAAVEVLFGKRTAKDVQSILEMDTAKIKAFPEEWMRHVTKKSLNRAGHYERIRRLQKKEVEKCVNQFMGKVYCERIKRVSYKK